MSAGNTFENDLMKLIFNATAIADIAEDDTTTPLTEFFVSLHTADPGEAGDQTTNEADYTSYARVSVARTSGGWTVSANAVSNAAAITFPQATGGSNAITHFGIGTLTSGTGKLLFKGALAATLNVSSGITPSFAIGELDVTAD